MLWYSLRACWFCLFGFGWVCCFVDLVWFWLLAILLRFRFVLLRMAFWCLLLFVHMVVVGAQLFVLTFAGVAGLLWFRRLLVFVRI